MRVSLLRGKGVSVVVVQGGFGKRSKDEERRCALFHVFKWQDDKEWRKGEQLGLSR